MNFPKEIKIELAASEDETRPRFCEPFLDIKGADAHLVATDGKMIVVVPVEIDASDTAGFVSEEVIKAARKTRVGPMCQVALNGNATFQNGATMPREGEAKGEPPDWRAAMPKEEDYAGARAVCLDVGRLWKISQAMGSPNLILLIENENKPVLIKAGHRSAAPQARGAIMPAKI